MVDAENNEATRSFSPSVKREAIRRLLEGEDVSVVANALGMPMDMVEDLIGKFILVRQRQVKRLSWEERQKSSIQLYRAKSISEIEFPEMLEPIPKDYLRN